MCVMFVVVVACDECIGALFRFLFWVGYYINLSCHVFCTTYFILYIRPTLFCIYVGYKL